MREKRPSLSSSQQQKWMDALISKVGWLFAFFYNVQTPFSITKDRTQFLKPLLSRIVFSVLNRKVNL